MPILKGPSIEVRQPMGIWAPGAMPSSTAWASVVAARKRVVSKAEVRILNVGRVAGEVLICVCSDDPQEIVAAVELGGQSGGRGEQWIGEGCLAKYSEE